MTKSLQTILDEALTVANQAAIEANAKLGPEQSRGLDCGFAWVNFPGNKPFGKHCKNLGLASKGYPTGLQIWYSKLHHLGTQSISVHEAAAKAFVDTCKANGITDISWASRLD